MKRQILVLFFLVGMVTTALASKTLRGVVISSEDKQPLIGASVYVSSADLKKAGSKQASLGVTTDLDGKFSISVPESVQRIYCSYIGYDVQEIKLLDGKNQYDIVLRPSAEMLETVVVTGYQTVERRKLTAAVSKIDLSDQMLGAAKSIDQALSGQIAGLQVSNISGTPGAPVKIRIRGTASLNGTQDPLWVLDGIPLEGTNIPKTDLLQDIDNIGQTSIAGLNPADIENITVLKDAAATAIYGARAANGVIVITTKKGKAGKPTINFSTKLTYSPKYDLDRLNLLNSDEKVGLELDLLQNNYQERKEKGEVYRILSALNEIETFQKGGYDALSKGAKDQLNVLRSRNTDWNDILLRDAFTQEYNLSLSGGSEKATYYTSVGYMKENGNIPNVSAERLNMVLKTSYKVNKLLKVGASAFINRRKNSTYLSDNSSFTNPMYYARLANPYFRAFDDNGNYLYDKDIQNDSSTDFGYNPFEERKNTQNETVINGVSSIFDAELRFNDSFKFTTQLGLQLDKTSIEKVADTESYVMRLERKNQRFNGTTFLPEGGFHKANENSNAQMTWKGMAEYRTNIDNVHEFEIMAGSEIRKTWLETLYSAGYGYDPTTMTTKPIIFPKESLAFPLHTKGYTENAYLSAFSTMSYSLLNRYTIGGSIRFDGSDLFGVDDKYRYLPLYSVSGLWRATQEPFMKNAKWLDNLVFRLSYGLQGNIDRNTSPYLLGTYKIEQILPGGNEHMITVDGAPNDKLRWEKTHSINTGFDFSAFNQGINLSVDYYYRKGVDLIGMRMLPLETGFVSSTINWASMKNQGIEVALTTRNIHTKSFMWTTNFNFAYNNNKVLRENVAQNSLAPSREGYPVGAIFVLKQGKIDDKGFLTFIDKEGKEKSVEEMFKLTPNDMGAYQSALTAKERRDLFTYAGTSDCPYTGGLINTFTYKAFELGVNLSYNFGGKVRTRPSYTIYEFDRGQNTNHDILNRWTPGNTNTNLPGLLGPSFSEETFMYNSREFFFSDNRDIYQNLDTWVKDLNFVRLQNIRLGYTLPSSINRMFGLSSAKVAIEARNLFVISSDYTNYLDPEVMSNPYAAPVPKSVTFSLNLNF